MSDLDLFKHQNPTDLQMNKIEYLLFKRSALQFKADLSELLRSLDSLNEEQMIVTSAYLRCIKKQVENLDERIWVKML